MSDGSEIHRLKEMDSYNEELFNKLFKNMKPLIKKLAKNIDARRFNVTTDIIQSYFYDKFIFVFNKYQNEYPEERLKATLLSSLCTFKNRLLKSAYGELAEYNQSLSKLEDLYEDSKEWVDDSEEESLKEERLELLYKYMRSNLEPDAYLIFQIQLDPPPMIKSILKNDNSKISIIHILDFLDLPRTKTNYDIISGYRKDIAYFLEKAKTDLGNQKTPEDLNH